MIRHILVAVGATRDDAVLKTAIDKARESGARLTAVYVVDTMPSWAMAGVEYGCLDTLQMVDEIEHTVERRCITTFELDAWDIHTRARTVPLHGSVGRTIARLADELDADPGRRRRGPRSDVALLGRADERRDCALHISRGAGCNGGDCAPRRTGGAEPAPPRAAAKRRTRSRANALMR